MPNLDYDPQNPSDLLGQPLFPGDRVAWGTTYGRSAALCIAEIDSFRFTKKNPFGYDPEYIECPQHEAERYTLRLRPIKSTGDVSWVLKDKPGKYMTDYRAKKEYGKTLQEMIDDGEVVAKLKSVLHVKNVVKL